ncbi:MAG: bifunctional demethylmenaquinone methyltransferase/2-methoxy-6-polyprenyl-1,4-benzoquinol methylase UbiE [Candidatus Hydrogenedentales bacterium]
MVGKANIAAHLPLDAGSPQVKAQTWRMFDRIAPSYDRLNRLISFRRDVAWRNVIARHLPQGNALRLIDLATGTGDVLLALHRKTGRIAVGHGLDMSSKMLDVGREKLAAVPRANHLALVRGDAGALCLASGKYNAATMAFGIRNVPDVPATLREIRRVLVLGGRALILEFSLPPNPLFRRIYLAYFRHVLPRIGGMVSGDYDAYRYLNESVEKFPHGSAFCRLMIDAGFHDVRAIPLTFGIVTLYRGDA